jgi:hypothetical protein
MNRRDFMTSASAAIAGGAGLGSLPGAAFGAFADSRIGQGEWTESSAASNIFPNPQIIRYDGQCFTIHGKDTFVYSGSFHYFRCPKELWAERFQKIKAAGFNCVETYTPWNVHEPDEPASLNDFSRVVLQDFDDWLGMAEDHKLYVIVRPGPFICAEWNRGGFPGWLVTKRPKGYDKPMWFRSDEPQFVAWSRHWLKAVLPTIARHQITRGTNRESGVIMVFLENEYSHTFDVPVRINVMRALGAEALAQGIDVPLAACQDESFIGSRDSILRRFFATYNLYPGWNVQSIAKTFNNSQRLQPDVPGMISEGQGGWFNFVWEKLQLQPGTDTYREGPGSLAGAQINSFALSALQNGVTALNYYMLVGGTNLGDTGGKDIMTSYDFSAPVRENGGVGEKYRNVAAIGRMLQEHGVALARSRAVDCVVDIGQKDVFAAVRVDNDGNRYLFVRTDQHDASRHGTATVRETASGKILTFEYDLKPGGSRILFFPAEEDPVRKGKWYPEEIPETSPPKDLPGPVVIREIASRSDAGPENWKELASGASLNDVGIFDSRFVYFRTSFLLDHKAVSFTEDMRLRIAYPTLAFGSWGAGDNGTRDRVFVSVNGRFRGEADAINGDLVLLASELHAGRNEIVMLYENSGYLKEDAWMEKESGIRGVRLLPDSPADRTLPEWKIFRLPTLNNLDARLEIDPAFDDHDWQAVKIEKAMGDQIQNGQAAIFRTSFEMTAQDIESGKTAIMVSQLSDYGRIFCNGKSIGTTFSKIISHTVDLASAIHPGRNVLAIIAWAENKISRSGLGLPYLTWPLTAGIQPDGPIQFSDQPVGIKGRWFQGASDEAEWTMKSLPESPSPDQSFLEWRRLLFQLPVLQDNLRIPWLVRLFVRGAGNIYINGHQLGRYSENGGQHDFYLPGCWLENGNKVDNVITLCLRPGVNGAGVQSAEIIPYTVYAEQVDVMKEGA